VTDPDEYLKEYILKRFYEDYPHAAPGAVVKAADVEWECECYSEYTRGDMIYATAVVINDGREIPVSYYYNLPQMIRDMAGEQDNCRIEEDE
jgi:hypothetical protein